MAEDWDQGETTVSCQSSIVVFGVRKGNPENIQDWDDLVQPGIEIVTAQPRLVGRRPLERPRRLGPGRRGRRHRGRGRRVRRGSSSATW